MVFRVDFNKPVRLAPDRALGIAGTNVSTWFVENVLSSVFVYPHDPSFSNTYNVQLSDDLANPLLLHVSANSAALPEHDEPWMSRFLALVDRKDKTDALQFLFSRVDELADAGKFGELNEFVASFEPEPLPAEVLVGLLRITYPFREKLSRWIDFLGLVYRILSQRGYNPKTVLAGLVA